MSAAHEVTVAVLRDLAETVADEQTVLSIYVDLDPASFATAPARASQIDSLLDGAHREIESGEHSHAALQSLRASLARARQLLTPNGEWAEDARAYALFLCEQLRLERGLRLAHPIAGAVVVADAPFIAPLVEEGPAGRVCVALIDERFARVLRGSGERLREVVSFGDPVHGRHDQGGWSQARYQRSRHEEVEKHLRHVARVLHDLLRIAPYQRLLIACTEPLWPRVLERLSPDVRALLDSERLSLDVGDAGIEDVIAAVRPVLQAEQRAHEDTVLARLREHYAREDDTRAAVGLQAVLSALVERRVEALLYDDRLSAAGVMCPRCGWLGTDGERCPVDDGPLEPRENIIEDALRAATAQSAEILPLHDRPELGPLGEIAATLRF
jgi:peptide chain release factor subunit 1